jgi:ketosteroid isomerase-like protein
MKAPALAASAFLLAAAPSLAQQVPAETAATNHRFEQAFNRGDAAAVAALYTENATLLPPGADLMTGRQAGPRRASGRRPRLRGEESLAQHGQHRVLRRRRSGDRAVQLARPRTGWADDQGRGQVRRDLEEDGGRLEARHRHLEPEPLIGTPFPRGARRRAGGHHREGERRGACLPPRRSGPVQALRRGMSGGGLQDGGRLAAPHQAVRCAASPRGRPHPVATASSSQVATEHVEIESGRRTDRPELQAALVACKAPRRCWSLPSSIGWRATCTSSPA